MITNEIPTETPFPLKDKNPSFRTLLRTFFYSNIRLKMKLWEDATVILADIPLNRKEANRILPLSMWLTKPYRMTFFVARYPKTAFTSAYNESAILFHVGTPLGKGVHVPWMVVDDITALIYGRELLGYPKKTADISFEDDGKTINTSLTRRDIPLVSLEGERIADETTPAPPITALKTFNIGGMGQLFAVHPVWMFKYKEVIHESYTAKVTLNIQNSDYDPIIQFIGEYQNPIQGRIAKLDILGFKALWPAGLSGPRVFKNSFNLKFR